MGTIYQPRPGPGRRWCVEINLGWAVEGGKRKRIRKRIWAATREEAERKRAEWLAGQSPRHSLSISVADAEWLLTFADTLDKNPGNRWPQDLAHRTATRLREIVKRSGNGGANADHHSRA